MADSTAVELLQLEVHYPGLPPFLGGLLLFCPGSNRVVIRTTSDWHQIPTAEREVFVELQAALQQLAESFGPSGFLTEIESSWSHTLRVSNRIRVAVEEDNMETAADLLASGLLQWGKLSV